MLNLWANGKNKRKDGLNWTCPADVKAADGLHWSPIGNNKAGAAIFTKFYEDIEARKWFLENKNTSMLDNSNSHYFSISPNPCTSYIKLETNIPGEYMAHIYNNLGQLIQTINCNTNTSTIPIDLPKGIYYILLNKKNYAYLATSKFSVNN